MRMLALLLEIVVAGSPRAEAATFPPGFVQSEIAAGLSETIAMAFSPES